MSEDTKVYGRIEIWQNSKYEWIEIRRNSERGMEIIFKETNKAPIRIRFRTDCLKIDAVLLRDVSIKHLAAYFNNVDTKTGHQTYTFPLYRKEGEKKIF